MNLSAEQPRTNKQRPIAADLRSSNSIIRQDIIHLLPYLYLPSRASITTSRFDLLPLIAMASLVRSTMLRQSVLSMATKPTPIATVLRLQSTTNPSNLFRPRTFQLTSVAPRIASFHTTTRRDILPPGPQVIDGGVNTPAPVPRASPTHGSYHWTFERLLSVGLIPLTIAPFAAGALNPITDAVFVAAILIHSHIGFQYVVFD